MSGGWLMALGVVSVILGLIALWNAVDASLVTAVIVGWVLAFSGGTHLIGAFGSGASGGWRILQALLGILYIVVGLDIVFDPISGVITLTVVIAIVLILEGLMRLWISLMQRGAGWGVNLVVGIVDILLGLWLWTGIPYTGVAIGVFVGLQLLFTGIAWVTLGMGARNAAGSASAGSL